MRSKPLILHGFQIPRLSPSCARGYSLGLLQNPQKRTSILHGSFRALEGLRGKPSGSKWVCILLRVLFSTGVKPNQFVCLFFCLSFCWGGSPEKDTQRWKQWWRSQEGQLRWLDGNVVPDQGWFQRGFCEWMFKRTHVLGL